MSCTTKNEPPAWAVATASDRQALAEGCYWDHTQANAVVRFAERVFRSQYIPGAITLRESQRRCLMSVYGFRRPGGERRFRFVQLHVPKKSFGKTLILAVIVLYEALASGEPSPVILCGAATRENAGMLYKEVMFALNHIIPLKKGNPNIKWSDAAKKIFIKANNATIECLSKIGRNNHGPQCSVAVIDEAHAADETLYRAIRYSGQARPNYMCLLASTAGDDTLHWYYPVYCKGKRVASSEEIDTQHYVMLHEADSEADHERDESTWFQANPHLGEPGGIPVDQFRRELQSAKATGVGEWYNALRLLLNVWVKPSDKAYLDVTNFDRYKLTLSDDELRKFPAACGADLAQGIDPSSVSMCWDCGDYYYFRNAAWVAEEGVKQRDKMPQLRKYREFPELTITPGNMIDYRTIRDYILDQCANHDIRSVNFDPTGAFMLANEVEEEGYTTQRVPQTFRYFNPAMNEFYRLWQEGKIRHDGSRWMRFCFQNVRIETNKYNEIRPYRKHCVDKFDCVVSCMLAFLGLISTPDHKSEVV